MGIRYFRAKFCCAPNIERELQGSISFFTTFKSPLLTLGAHAQRGLQYLVCHSVCLSVCLSVCPPRYSGSTRNYVCVYVCMSVCVYVCMSACVYECMSVCVYEYMRVSVYHPLVGCSEFKIKIGSCVAQWLTIVDFDWPFL